MTYKMDGFGEECQQLDPITGECYDQYFPPPPTPGDCQIYDSLTGQCYDDYMYQIPGVDPPGGSMPIAPPGASCAPGTPCAECGMEGTIAPFCYTSDAPPVGQCPHGSVHGPTGQCVPVVVQCPEGWSKDPVTQMCFSPGVIPDEDPTVWQCPPGSVHGPTGQCVPVVAQCPAGTTGTFPDCVPVAVQCPAGTTGTFPDCVPVAVQCPAGTTGTFPDCKPVAQECPDGLVRSPTGECVKGTEETRSSLAVPIIIGALGLGTVAYLIYSSKR